MKPIPQQTKDSITKHLEERKTLQQIADKHGVSKGYVSQVWSEMKKGNVAVPIADAVHKSEGG